MFIDYLSPDFVDRAHEWVRDARGSEPVSCPFGRVVLSFEEQRRVLASADAKVLGTELLARQGITDGPLHDFFASQLLARDGADHRRLRRLVSPAFTPRALEPFRCDINALFDRLVEPHVTRASRSSEPFDAVQTSARFPVGTICLLFGAPASLEPSLLQWVPLILSMFDPGLDERRGEIEGAVVSLEHALTELVEQRRDSPGNDLISTLIAVEESGDRLTDAELVMLSAAVLIGGTESTRLQLLNLISLLGEHPEQWQRLRHQPELIETAVEEGLRFRPVPHAAYRRLSSDIGDLAGGSEVVCDFLAANRDPASNERPNDFDVGRERSNHLTFSSGAHFCVGANLARIELAEALRVLTSRIDHLEIVEARYPKAYSNSWGPERLLMKIC